MRLLSIFLVLATSLLCGLPQTSIQRGMPAGTKEIPLAINGLGLPSSVGLADRDADHATVAMNADLDIAVAFHTSRPDIMGNGNMKQVEVAYYEHQTGDTWTYVDTVLVGSIDYHPIPFLPQQIVKCERPDIIAVGNRFFVTWTRRYDKTFAGQSHEPAVLECAWIEKGVGPSISVIGYSALSPGRGFQLAAHVPGGTPSQRFEIRDCAGVPDAVVLNDSSLPAGRIKVGVVYPHKRFSIFCQTWIGSLPCAWLHAHLTPRLVAFSQIHQWISNPQFCSMAPPQAAAIHQRVSFSQILHPLLRRIPFG